MNDIRPPGQQIPEDADRESQGDQQSWGFVEREAEPQYIDHLQRSSTVWPEVCTSVLILRKHAGKCFVPLKVQAEVKNEGVQPTAATAEAQPRDHSLFVATI